MARAISIYLRKNKIYLVPLARVPSGGHIETEPVQIVDLQDPLETLGRSILSSLESSDQLLPDPPLAKIYSPAQIASGAKTWRQFIYGTAACDLEHCKTEFIITPLKPERGPSFSYEPEKAVMVPSSSFPEELAIVLLKIIKECEKHLG